MPPTLTPNRGYLLADPDDPYDIEVQNDNWATADNVSSQVVICTSTSRPSSPVDGDLIFETDSLNFLVRHSGAWKSFNAKIAIGTSGARPASTLTFGGYLFFETDTGNLMVRNAANSAWLFVTGDSLRISSTGTLYFGPDASMFYEAGGRIRTAIGTTLYSYNSMVSRVFCHARATASQAVAHATWTEINMPAEVVDTNNSHSTVTNTARFTPAVAGYYTFRGMVAFNGSNNAGDRGARFRKNGLEVIEMPYHPISALNGTVFLHAAAPAIGGTVAMNGTTDYVSLWATQNCGGTLDAVFATDQICSYWIAEWVAPL